MSADEGSQGGDTHDAPNQQVVHGSAPWEEGTGGASEPKPTKAKRSTSKSDPKPAEPEPETSSSDD
jgi:hypothetical protein